MTHKLILSTFSMVPIPAPVLILNSCNRNSSSRQEESDLTLENYTYEKRIIFRLLEQL
jgi:hypothetical protein